MYKSQTTGTPTSNPMLSTPQHVVQHVAQGVHAVPQSAATSTTVDVDILYSDKVYANNSLNRKLGRVGPSHLTASVTPCSSAPRSNLIRCVPHTFEQLEMCG